MTLYSIALFLHIVGALGLFAALALEWASLWYLRRVTTTEQVHQWLQAFALSGRFYPAVWIAILLPGFYMTATVWRGTAWIGVAFAAIFLFPLLGMAITARRLAVLRPALAAEKGLLSPALRQGLRDPLLWASLQTRIAIALGIVFLMAVKPALGGALLTIGVAIVLGLVSAWPAWGRVRLQEARGEN